MCPLTLTKVTLLVYVKAVIVVIILLRVAVFKIYVLYLQCKDL